MVRFLLFFLCVSLYWATFSGLEADQREAEYDLKIYLDLTSKYHFQQVPASAPYRRLLDLLNESGLQYELVYTPWNRAIASVQSEDNSLIYQLLRTEERESQFHWIMPATDAEPLRLYGRSPADNYVAAATSEDELLSLIQAGRYSAACTVGSAQCEFLLEYGFPKKKVVRASMQQEYGLEILLARKRVDFIAVFESSFLPALKRLNYKRSDFQRYAILDVSVDYLAAGKGRIDTQTLALLKTIASQMAIEE